MSRSLRIEYPGAFYHLTARERKKGTGYFVGFIGLYGSFGFLGLVQSRALAGLQTLFYLSDFFFESRLTQRSKLNKLFKLSD
jgi:hypothetical protein